MTNESGQGLTEYLILLGLVAIVVVIGLTAIGGAIGPLEDLLPNLLGL